MDRNGIYRIDRGECRHENYCAFRFDPNTLIGHSTQKIFRSLDGGATWNSALDFSADGTILKKIAYSGDRNIVYIGATKFRVYKSTDGGASFAQTSGNIQTLIGH